MISVSRMKALKRRRIGYVHNDECAFEPHSVLLELPNGPHAPAKAEARVLRRICAQTGLSPEQVREHKAYRRQLSAASKPVRGRHPAYSRARAIRKAVSAATGLHPLHPDFLPAFAKLWDDFVLRHTSRYRAYPAAAVPAVEALQISLQRR